MPVTRIVDGLGFTPRPGREVFAVENVEWVRFVHGRLLARLATHGQPNLLPASR